MFIIYSISLSSHTKFLFYVYFMLTVAPEGNNLATICYKDFFWGLAHYKICIIIIIIIYYPFPRLSLVPTRRLNGRFIFVSNHCFSAAIKKLYIIKQSTYTIYPNGQTVSAVDSSASWVNVSRCEFKSSYHDLLYVVPRGRVVHVKHYSVELDT